ncbi:Hpt domain-containing protein [Polymorphum gilvum]|uniref:Hpt domain protein n=1 Tax=Polymorphum gilvum (strain LMG 25793 / CGMCC 1.9160 / SL003B-26A1) TaxID=991905 RepID=F2J3C0_POLGS|nr:Hpt domain-containing protein [Polymorphum gilvum]ADZ69927.1 Hpt domain protein [Polymorphum gilvum SL003B-26A1]
MARTVHQSAGKHRPHARDHAPVDLVFLATNTLGNRSLEQEVLRLFLKQSGTLMARLEGCADNASCADLVHTLKGSARGIGAHRVAFVCEGVEAELRAGRVPPLVALEAAVAEANGFIRDLVGA